ncbi:MAG: murein L,D-transpeptidase [Chitinispirillaceae bacterium]|nr:murein L,D-transpeptidase [Chitinispirillaceae bacterium]
MKKQPAIMHLPILLSLLLVPFVSNGQALPEKKPYITTKRKIMMDLTDAGLSLKNGLYIRIFKHDRVLQIFVEKDGTYRLFKVYPICRYSGDLGPKKKQGDRQAPEGYYSIMKHHLNPNSDFYKAVNVGYPNEYDRSHHYTGSAIMIHGGCSSIGCFAMSDSIMMELYFIVAAGLQHQKVIPVHIFPFDMSDRNMEKFMNMKEDNDITNTINSLPGKEIGYKYADCIGLWKTLKEGFDYFEKNRIPPKVNVVNGNYVIARLREKADE